MLFVDDEAFVAFSSHQFIKLLCFLCCVETTESNKEMNRRELLNQPMRVQFVGLPCTVIIKFHYQSKINLVGKKPVVSAYPIIK